MIHTATEDALVADTQASKVAARHRALAQRYLEEAMRVPFRLESHREGTVGANGFVQGPGMQFKCGCWIPTGYPLWRTVNPCDKHLLALEPRGAR